MSIIPWILCGCLCGILLYMRNRQKRTLEEMNSLIKEIDHFIQQEQPIDFSLHDTRWARLQNSVADLAELVLLERNKLKASEFKNSSFISDISHQLKTPIAGLKLFLQMDQMGQPTAHNRQELELVEKMEQLVFELLRLEKIKVDSYLMEFAPVSLAQVAAKQADQIQPLFPDCRIEVEGESTMRADAKWLGEALGNVLKNACEHSAAGGAVKLRIEENSRSTLITIADQGGGVKPEQLPNLFERFFKTENASKNSTGIGLAIAKAIVERHHGLISAENKDGGLQIAICLPHIDGYEAIE